MEIHARYIWVGLITFIAILGTVWYILWISTSKDGTSQSLYDIYFSQNIAGLQEGSSVLLRGVPVGRVVSIRFDPKHAEQVRVRIQVTSTAPIRQDSIATIEPQGITGLANIQITGGSPSSPYLRPFDADDVPVITAGTSRFEEILSAVPNILVTTTTI
ncbi:MAG: MlaD family protein, partial [Desulfovibrionaceae bacterium]|nr:MlaD family protein [Desulfovibrionaceae bacterium]